MTAFLTGFSLGFSLILAIGAQNAFILRQGLRKTHVLACVLTCAISDAILISIGVAFFASLSETLPQLAPIMRWLGAAFLIIYGGMALKSAWLGTSSLQAADTAKQTLRSAVLTVLALTWLNPHVYLDTVLLIGSIATRYPGEQLQFGAGAVLSSVVFFFSLGYGARILTPLFARPSAWRILDVIICAIMWSIAAGLILHG
jgi:L-lysine exporter family protein LysE/ArgO